MSRAPVYALWEPEIGAAWGGMIWWLHASGARSAVASLLWQLWMWLRESPSWSVARDDSWKKGKSKCGYRCMSIGMATWKTPVDVWGWVGAWSSEFQETTNWGRSSGEDRAWVRPGLGNVSFSGSPCPQAVPAAGTPHARWGKRRLVYQDVCCPL